MSPTGAIVETYISEWLPQRGPFRQTCIACCPSPCCVNRFLSRAPLKCDGSLFGGKQGAPYDSTRVAQLLVHVEYTEFEDSCRISYISVSGWHPVHCPSLCTADHVCICIYLYTHIHMSLFRKLRSIAFRTVFVSYRRTLRSLRVLQLLLLLPSHMTRAKRK